MQKNSDLDRLLRSFLPKFLLPSSTTIFDPSFIPRIALFGPGIESPSTKHLVHKTVNSHTSVFDAQGFVSGLPGGFGSGVRIDFRKTFIFDLICLYTNSSRVREYQRGVTRLLAGNNRMLVNDFNSDAEVVLHENVLKLLPTMNVLAFAVDGSELKQMTSEKSEDLHENIEYLRSELRIMRDAIKDDIQYRHIPILVLFCLSETDNSDRKIQFDLSKFAKELLLSNETERAWAIFEVNIGNMDGMAKAMDWVLYHVQKRRNALEYHKAQSSSGYV